MNKEKQSPWRIIDRDSCGFATERSMDEIFDNVPCLLLSATGNLGIIERDDDLLAWRGDIERDFSLKYYMPVPSFDDILAVNKEV